MNIKNYIFTLLAILLNVEHHINAQRQMNYEINCMIKNKLFLNEYLYASKQESINSNKKYESTINTYLYPIGKVSDVKKINWRLIKSVHKNETYYIKNLKYDQYLCVDNILKNMFGIKLIIKTIDIDESTIRKVKNCEWDLKRVDLNKNDFYILAKSYDQLLSASSSFIRDKSMLKRNVFFWPKSLQVLKKSLMDQQWNFQCN